jgi:hypothetical protein
MKKHANRGKQGLLKKWSAKQTSRTDKLRPSSSSAITDIRVL